MQCSIRNALTARIKPLYSLSNPLTARSTALSARFSPTKMVTSIEARTAPENAFSSQ